ncbi:hypothetical protein SXHG_00029 [Synechococcus phage MRHenn-2013a]|nr:hypothetical protein SXHG_00029 [Synechococcus phage MRHenn-2013a]
MRAFVISLPRGEENPTSFRLIVKSGPCFNLFNGSNMLINREKAVDCYDYVMTPEGGLTATHCSENGNLMDNDNWEVHAIGWVREGMHSLFKHTADGQTEANKLKLKQNLGLYGFSNSPSDIFPSHFAYRKQRTQKEQKLLDMFKRFKATRGNIANPAQMNISGYFKEMALGQFSLWYDLVGTDRKMTMAIGYLMSYRNIINNITYMDQSVPQVYMDSIVATATAQVCQAVPRVHADFLYSLFSHHGDDSDIFAYAGPKAVAIGLTEGFFGLEKYISDYGPLDSVKRYNKGGCSNNLARAIDKVTNQLQVSVNTNSLIYLRNDSALEAAKSYLGHIFRNSPEYVKEYTKCARDNFEQALRNVLEGKKTIKLLIEMIKHVDKLYIKEQEAGSKEAVKSSAKGFQQWVNTSDEPIPF